MLSSIAVMAISGILAIALFLLNQAERAKGRRILMVSIREKLDGWLLRRAEGWNRWKRYVGASSFRLFLHYLLHQGLGAALFLIRWLEARLHGLRKRNRLVAKVSGTESGGHLRDIAAHKEEVALSEEERKERMERSLNDH